MLIPVQLAYNFLYGLWLYQWDADCELFLKILAGEIREEVYIAQNRLQTDMEDLFAALDKAKGQATGTIPKEDVRTALHSFFRVGESGGKTAVRFDEAMQAMDADQPGAVIEWKKVFEEDREFNQGEFAESLRDQFLQERLEFFSALETALYEQVGDGDECTAEQVIQAILATDQDCEQKVADSTVKATFGPGVHSMAVKVVMKKLSRGILRGNVLSRDSVAGQGQGRQSQSSNGSARGSIASKGRGSMNSGKDSGSKVGGFLPNHLRGYCFPLHCCHTIFWLCLQVCWPHPRNKIQLYLEPWKPSVRNGFTSKPSIVRMEHRPLPRERRRRW